MLDEFKRELEIYSKRHTQPETPSKSIKTKLCQFRFENLLTSQHIVFFEQILNDELAKNFFKSKIIERLTPNKLVLARFGYDEYAENHEIQHCFILFEILIFSCDNAPTNQFINSMFDSMIKNLTKLKEDLVKLIEKHEGEIAANLFIKELKEKKLEIEISIEDIRKQKRVKNPIGGHSKTTEQILLVRFLVKNFLEIYGKKFERFAAVIFDIKYGTSFAQDKDTSQWSWITQTCRGNKLDNIPSLLSE